jgi:hypothetical protein
MPQKRIKKQLEWMKKTESARQAITRQKTAQRESEVNAIAPGYYHNKDTVDPEGLKTHGKKRRR